MEIRPCSFASKTIWSVSDLERHVEDNRGKFHRGIDDLPCFARFYRGSAQLRSTLRIGADWRPPAQFPRYRGDRATEAAAMLNLSIYTVETHRTHILQKLNLHNVPELILYAVRKGIIA